MRKIVVMPLAELDLSDIWDWIAADNPDAAARYIEQIVAKFLLLAEYPKSGSKRVKLPADVRLFVVQRHVILYRFSSDRVDILRVLHSSRNLERFFSR